MKVPYSWLKDFVDIDVAPAELADRLVKAGFEIEDTDDWSQRYRNIVVGCITAIDRHPNADKLQVCRLDVGDGTPRQIVTSATNVAVGDYVPVCLDGAVLPDGKEIHAGQLRGVQSDGMMCGGSELDLNDSDYTGAGYDGIFILNRAFDIATLRLGQDIKEVIDADDIIFDVLVTANRPDANSILGVAREVCAVFDLPLKSFAPPACAQHGNVRDMVTVQVEDSTLCPRYMIKGVDHVVIAPSPVLVRRRLRKVGIRPINNIVDITNYILIELGQPMHAFDYTKVEGNQIVVRRAVEGEHIVTLDGKDNDLTPDNLVICNANRPMALAGIMGGMDSGISDTTTTILLESARFKRDNIRRSSKALGIRSDSSARFEKGIDFVSQQWAIARAVQMIVDQGAGQAIGGLWDVFDGNCDDRVICASAAKINRILGVNIPVDTIVSLLNRLQLATVADGDTLTVTVPAYREDILNANDLAEEVIRLYGYDNFVSASLDGMSQTHGVVTPAWQWTNRIKQLLSGSLGYHEIFSYSFVTPRFADLLQLPADDARRNYIKLLNPLGEELSVMRTTLLHSMLKTIALNDTRGNKDIKLYEIGKVYWPSDTQPSEEVETLMLAEVGKGTDFYTIKSALNSVASKLNITLAYSPSEYTYLHPTRAASVLLDGQVVGYIGEVHPTVAAEGYKLDGRVQVAELTLAPLFAAAKAFLPFRPLPKFPAVSRDLAFVVKKSVTAAQVLDTVRSAGGAYLEDAAIFDVYEGLPLPPTAKSMAVALTFRAADRTLVDAEVNEAIEHILDKMRQQLDAVLR